MAHVRALLMIFYFSVITSCASLDTKSIEKGSYELLSEKKSLKLWESMNTVEIGDQISPSTSLSVVKLVFTDIQNKKSNLIIRCEGRCAAQPCGQKIWRYGCFQTETCNRREYIVEEPERARQMHWLHSFSGEERSFIAGVSP